MIYSNVCERCGGLKTASFASGIIQHSAIKMCDCPQPPEGGGVFTPPQIDPKVKQLYTRERLPLLISFMEQLAKAGMPEEAIAARGYDYALMLCRFYVEAGERRDTEISPLLHIQIMDYAADLLKFAVEKQRQGGPGD